MQENESPATPGWDNSEAAEFYIPEVSLGISEALLIKIGLKSHPCWGFFLFSVLLPLTALPISPESTSLINHVHVTTHPGSASDLHF